MKEFWNERFSSDEYIYGEEPNEYLKEKLKNLTPARILFPADGEGRNGVYAASQHWNVSSFDQSIQGKRKARLLAVKKKTSIEYAVAGVEEAGYPANSFEALALIFAHFPQEFRKNYHKKLSGFLKKGGALIIEGFSKRHALHQAENPSSGGPRDVSMLYELEELKSEFPDFVFSEAYEAETTLSEGEFHKGPASVIRIFGIKK
ncbi:MAG: class I SAM-dependent methyltransferase [Bacteroidia bacterium]|nr:methyltransferase domain-containing protein [Bacteroidia bacterium]MCZ2276943.1 class I SAM-dependent methyltransferase [Bacteroidia bacterium]